MPPKDPPRGVDKNDKPPSQPKKGRARNPDIKTTQPSVDLGSGSAVLGSESAATADTQTPNWLTAPASEKSGAPTAPSCSDVAGNAGWSMAVLHELGAYCVGLPLAGDGWKDDSGRWSNRERLDHRFVEFRRAIQPRRWNQAFQNPASCGVTATLTALHAALCEDAAKNFQHGVALEGEVLQYLLPRIAVVLQAVARAQRFLRMKGVDGIALSEADYRHSLDQFLDDLLNDEPNNRSTLNERTLNFPRNEIYDEVAADKTPALSASAIRKSEHIFFRGYLNQGLSYYADVTDLPADRAQASSTSTKYQLGKAALAAIDRAFATQPSKWELVFFRELISMRLTEEDANLKAWGKVPMTREGRLRVSPRTGKCDAVNFLHVKVKLPVPAELAVPDAIQLLRECSLVQLTDADVKEIKDDGETLPKDAKDLAAYRACPQLGRTVNLGNVNDVIGHAALFANMRTPPAPKPQTSQQNRAAQGLPLLLPVLLYEYKKNLSSHSSMGLFQLRLYLNATCRFLAKLGVFDFMTFGILTEGTQVVVVGAWRDTGFGDDPAMTWIVDQYTASYDISKPQDAFQLACFVVWVKVVHMPRLAKLLTEERLALFVTHVLAREPEMEWTMNHQLPLSTKTKEKKTPPAEGNAGAQ